MAIHQMTVYWDDETGELRLEGSAPNNVVALGMLTAGAKMIPMRPSKTAPAIVVPTMKMRPNGGR